MSNQIYRTIKQNGPVRLGKLMILFALGFTGSAYGHVSYVDLSNPLVSPGGVNGGSFSTFGWFDGTTSALGDSHDLAGGDFFRFHLDAASEVSIVFSDLHNSGLLNPAFSLYNGILSDEAHDDTSVDPLNPKASKPPFPKIASSVDDGVSTDFFGRVSPFRDTVNVNYRGQFNALDSWSMANESGDWAVLQYITHVSPAGGNSVSLLNFFLPAGDYTIAAAGGTDPSVLSLTNIQGRIEFSANPVTVPLPGAVWLFGSVLLGFGFKRESAKRSA